MEQAQLVKELHSKPEVVMNLNSFNNVEIC